MKEEQFNQLPSQGTIYSVGRLGSHLIIGTGNYGKIYAHIWASIMQQLPLQNLPCNNQPHNYVINSYLHKDRKS